MPAFTTRQGYTLYYELHGKPGDPLVTIINGLSMRTAQWAPYFESLPAGGCQVLTYDLVGQGQSSKPVLGGDFDDHVGMLHELHEHLDIQRPYVMGISFGGVVALKYAFTYPDAIAGLLPMSTFSELDPQLKAHSMNLYMGLARVGFEFYLDLLMPLNFTNEWLADNGTYMGLIKRMGASTNELYGIQNLMESLADFESFSHRLADISCPSLILNAEFDWLTPRHLHDILRREIPSSRLVLVPKMCHAFTLEIPALTSRLIVEFVKSVEEGHWEGDQSVWIADEDPAAKPLLTRCRANHLRGMPVPEPEPATASMDAAQAAKPAKAPARAASPPRTGGTAKPAKAGKKAPAAKTKAAAQASPKTAKTAKPVGGKRST